jgi:hypothetical protein
MALHSAHQCFFDNHPYGLGAVVPRSQARPEPALLVP